MRARGHDSAVGCISRTIRCSLFVLAWICLIAGPHACANAGTAPRSSGGNDPASAAPSRGTFGTGANLLNGALRQKLAHPDVILQEFEKGKERVKVIVNLVEPSTSLTEPTPGRVHKLEVIRRYQERLQKRHAEVETLQTPVLAPLSEKHLQLRHRFQNWASFAGDVTREGLAKLAADPLVESIEFDYPMKRLTKQGIALMHGTEARTTYNGQGVAIAIVDDGIDYRHPDLGGAAFPNSKVIGGYDVADKDFDPGPDTTLADCAHGTNCAGIAAGDVPSAGELAQAGNYAGGVACGAKLYAVKVFSRRNGDIYDSDVIAAWDWCLNHKSDDPAHPLLVISVSLGQDPAYIPTEDYTASARKATDVVRAGITLVAAAGNSGWCNSLEWPACLSDVISVGAVYDADLGTVEWEVDQASCAPKTWNWRDRTWYATDVTAADKVAPYSNVSPALDLFAPSNDASTTDVVDTTYVVGVPGNYEPEFGGTSASSPYAAGAVACLQSAAYAHHGQYLSPLMVRDILARTGDPVTDTKAPITKPRINLNKAVEEVLTGQATTVVPLYRFWLVNPNRHFYTIDEAERNKLVDDPYHVWTYETIAYHALSDGSLAGAQPVYRFWSNTLTAHFYTISASEKDVIIAKYPRDVWQYEGPTFYAWPAGAQPADASPVYRFWSDSLGTHFYTMSTAERDKLLTTPASWFWAYEGVAWYAYK